MKKSLHSILTAAMFAAAVTTSVGNPTVSAQNSDAPAESGLMQETERMQQGVYGPPNWFTTEPELTKLTDTEPQDVYGPPNWFSETETLTTTDVTRDIPPTVYGPPYWYTDTETEATVTTTTDVTEIIPQPAYGPPWIFAETGDLNYDGVLNAADLSLLKRAILDGIRTDEILHLGDTNSDGTIDKKDVRELIRQLTGKPDEPEETDVTVLSTDTTIPTTSTVPLYGPPAAY